MNSTRFSQAWLKAAGSYPTHSWLCGVVVKILDWESVGSEIKYSNFCFFFKENPSLISVILNTKLEKHDCFGKK